MNKKGKSVHFGKSFVNIFRNNRTVDILLYIRVEAYTSAQANTPIIIYR